MPEDGLQIDGRPVVYTRCGEGTGDAVYHTADGRVWETCSHSTDANTGETISTIEYDGGRNA